MTRSDANADARSTDPDERSYPAQNRAVIQREVERDQQTDSHNNVEILHFVVHRSDCPIGSKKWSTVAEHSAPPASRLCNWNDGVSRSRFQGHTVAGAGRRALWRRAKLSVWSFAMVGGPKEAARRGHRKLPSQVGPLVLAQTRGTESSGDEPETWSQSCRLAKMPLTCTLLRNVGLRSQLAEWGL